MDTFSCSESAVWNRDQLIGTAKPIRLFLALEFWPPWHRKAIESPGLPDEVRHFWALIRAAIPQSRFLAIRQSESKNRSPKCFVAIPNGPRSVLYQFELISYRNIIDIPVLDLFARATSPTTVPTRDLQEPQIFLVCTHAKRDTCCARQGNPVYQAIREWSYVWETSHLGGCRFAANMLSLPNGLLFGQVSPGAARKIVESNRIDALECLEHLRGRSNYARHIQAAEYFVRAQYRITGMNDLCLVESSSTDDSTWKTIFAGRSDRTSRYELAHRVRRAAEPRILSCNDTEPEFTWIHKLVSLTQTDEL
jgi:hypothetical protein